MSHGIFIDCLEAIITCYIFLGVFALSLAFAEMFRDFQLEWNIVILIWGALPIAEDAPSHASE